jgi:hypothetical protein
MIHSLVWLFDMHRIDFQDMITKDIPWAHYVGGCQGQHEASHRSDGNGAAQWLRSRDIRISFEGVRLRLFSKFLQYML